MCRGIVGVFIFVVMLDCICIDCYGVIEEGVVVGYVGSV